MTCAMVQAPRSRQRLLISFAVREVVYRWLPSRSSDERSQRCTQDGCHRLAVCTYMRAVAGSPHTRAAQFIAVPPVLN